MQLERLDEAQTLLREGLALQPTHPLLHQNLMAVHARAGNDAAGRQELERWLAAVPKDTDGWHELALVQFAAGEREAACGSAEKALALLAAATGEAALSKRAAIDADLGRFRSR